MAEFGTNNLNKVVRSFERGGQVGSLCKKYHLSGRTILKSLLQARRHELLGERSLSRVLMLRKEVRFPSNSQARFDRILRCMNTELKQAILLAADWYPRTYVGLYNKLSVLTKSNLPTPQVLNSYCTDTLTPAGLLTMETFGRGLRYAERNFRLNQAGADYGQTIAAFSIKYAVDHNVSLYELLGQSQSVGSSNSPRNRVRILEILSAGQNRIVDLTSSLGLSIGDVRQHLDSLSKLGILTYESLNFEKKGMKLYRWVEGRMPNVANPICELRKLTQDVANWLYLNKSGERNQIAEALDYRHVNHISTILGGLLKQGLVNTQFTFSNKSNIILLKKSRLILDYSFAVRGALDNGPMLLFMREVLKEFSRDKHVFTRYLDAGLDLYRQTSPHINRKKFEDREIELLAFIQGFQERERVDARPVDAINALGWTEGTVTRCLRSLLKKGHVVGERSGPAARYRAVGSS